jgi:acetyl-CoA carboxylase biotin carboxylase subunit
VPPFYDSLIAKLICSGDTREEALKRMEIALDEMLIDGISSNIALHKDLARDSEFRKGGVNIHYLEKKLKL